MDHAGDASAGWARAAGAAVTEALASAPRWRTISGMWSTARTRYDRVSLPPEFSIRTVDVGSARRRLAVCPGAGAPLFIVPGLFASLHERLFVEIAAEARRLGRPVTVVEDRFAAETLSLNGPELPTTGALVGELATLLHAADEPADVIALSAGAMSALFVSAPVRRMTAWSAAVSPSAVLAHASSNILVRRHFGRIAREAFASIGAEPPRWQRLVEALARDESQALLDVPMLLIHARDDPVAPVEEVERLGPKLRQHQLACIVPRGGHLGFGPVCGAQIYVLPIMQLSR